MIIKNITLCSSVTQQYISDFHTTKATHWGGELACASVQERVGGRVGGSIADSTREGWW